MPPSLYYATSIGRDYFSGTSLRKFENIFVMGERARPGSTVAGIGEAFMVGEISLCGT